MKLPPVINLGSGKQFIDGALNVGWRHSDVIEAVLHAGAVTGSRAVDQGLDIARQVFAARALDHEFETRIPNPESRPAGLDDKPAATIAVAALTAVAAERLVFPTPPLPE